MATAVLTRVIRHRRRPQRYWLLTKRPTGTQPVSILTAARSSVVVSPVRSLARTVGMTGASGVSIATPIRYKTPAATIAGVSTVSAVNPTVTEFNANYFRVITTSAKEAGTVVLVTSD